MRRRASNSNHTGSGQRMRVRRVAKVIGALDGQSNVETQSNVRIRRTTALAYGSQSNATDIHVHNSNIKQHGSPQHLRSPDDPPTPQEAPHTALPTNDKTAARACSDLEMLLQAWECSSPTQMPERTDRIGTTMHLSVVAWGCFLGRPRRLQITDGVLRAQSNGLTGVA